ncbi:MAG: molecular chaperone GrpE [Bryobacterales bacterium]|jgi:molecular chaperone GrpE|nr:molecular chaperone GrpE [Bryobacterales bacterium]
MVENSELKADVEQPNVDQAETVTDSATDQSTQLRSERDQLKAERDELKELLLRRQAEFDNFRKRTERERSEYLQFASMEAVRDLLPVLDDFDRALKAESGHVEYAKGVEMIYTRMYEALKKLGLEPIETAGAQFDPHLHQAIERVETSDAPDNTVLGEFQRGYHFKGKMLRPSMVRVAVKS